jgi:anhydro-N-acetylmuramic acid kinase
MPTEHHIGLMSGTSLDGVDGVLLHSSNDGMRIRGAHHIPMPAALRSELLSLNASGPDELHRSTLAAQELVRLYADAVHTLVDRAGLQTRHIAALGAHGQTVRHLPATALSPAPSGSARVSDTVGYTLQINQPALLAELTGITVVADFRSRDVAAGGQGAPLVPAFHQAVFSKVGADVAIVNVGGMANVTLLPAQGPVSGFDTGPGNVLMDHWCERHTGLLFDSGGQWARTGTVHNGFLAHLLDEPFFAKRGIKSTGRDNLNASWLESKLARFPSLAAQDVQATLLELTATTIAQALSMPDGSGTDWHQLVVCGGGAMNDALLQRLQYIMEPRKVLTSDAMGWPAMQVEAAAFAWLARETLHGRPGNLTAVTGAKGPRVLGAIYPA